MAESSKPQKSLSTQKALEEISAIAGKGDLWDSGLSGFTVSYTYSELRREHAWNKWKEHKKAGMLASGIVSVVFWLATYFIGTTWTSVLKGIVVAVVTFVGSLCALWLVYWLSAPKAIIEGLGHDLEAAQKQLIEEKRKLQALAEISKAKIEELKDGHIFQSAAISQMSHMAELLQVSVEIGNDHQFLPTRPMYFDLLIGIKNYSLWPLNIYGVEGRIYIIGFALFEQSPMVVSHTPIQNLTNGNSGHLRLRQHTTPLEMEKLLSGQLTLSFANATIPVHSNLPEFGQQQVRMNAELTNDRLLEFYSKDSAKSGETA